MLKFDHRWNVTPKDAGEIQIKLAEKVIHRSFAVEISTIAGIDVGVRGGDAKAAVVVLRYPTLETIESATATRPLGFP